MKSAASRRSTKTRLVRTYIVTGLFGVRFNVKVWSNGRKTFSRR